MRNIFSLLLLAVAYMSKVLGNSKNCAVDYAADGSGSNANKAKRTFENYGYKNVTKRLGCESGDIKRIDSYLPDNPCTPWGWRSNSKTSLTVQRQQVVMHQYVGIILD